MLVSHLIYVTYVCSLSGIPETRDGAMGCLNRLSLEGPGFSYILKTVEVSIMAFRMI